jgi:hypothetical protein
MPDDDSEKMSLTEAVLTSACDDTSYAALEIMERVGERFDMHVIQGASTLEFDEEGEAIEVTMIFRFTLPKGQKRSDTDA